MNPENIKKLLELEQTKEFIAFLAREIEKLNDLSDIKLNDPMEIAVEVRGRQRAYEKLLEFLSPFLNYNKINEKAVTNNDYLVE